MAIYKVGDKYFDQNYNQLGTESDVKSGNPPDWARGGVASIPLKITTQGGTDLPGTIDYASQATGLSREVIQNLLNAAGHPALRDITPEQLSKEIINQDLIDRQAANVNIASIPKQQYGDNITLPNGQVISKNDPNYATYAKQAGIQPTQETQKNNEVINIPDNNQKDLITLSNGQTIIRDINKEKVALAEYGKIYGKMPQSDADWQKLHDIAYVGDKKATIPQGFEKIAHPDLIGSYDNIRRIGNIGEPGSYLIGKKKVDNTIINANTQANEIQKTKDILNKYGVENLDSNQSPMASFTDIYKKIFEDLGLVTLKQNIEDSTTAIQKLKDEMNDKITDINDNPWLSEALRSKKIKNIQNSYENKLTNLTEKLQLDQSLYRSGQQEAQFIANKGVEIAHNQDVLDQQMQLKLMDIAETQSRYKDKNQFDLLKEGWTYVSTPAERDNLKSQGYQITQTGGRTYAKAPVSIKRKTGGTTKNNISNQTKNQWTQTKANELYKKYINGGYSAQEALRRVNELTGYTVKGTNYTATNIPSDLKNDLMADVQSGHSEQDIINAYPEVSSSYIKSLIPRQGEEEIINPFK
jgi:hypothetical protein